MTALLIRVIRLFKATNSLRLSRIHFSKLSSSRETIYKPFSCALADIFAQPRWQYRCLFNGRSALSLIKYGIRYNRSGRNWVARAIFSVGTDLLRQSNGTRAALCPLYAARSAPERPCGYFSRATILPPARIDTAESKCLPIPREKKSTWETSLCLWNAILHILRFNEKPHSQLQRDALTRYASRDFAFHTCKFRSDFRARSKHSLRINSTHKSNALLHKRRMKRKKEISRIDLSNVSYIYRTATNFRLFNSVIRN